MLMLIILLSSQKVLHLDSRLLNFVDVNFDIIFNALKNYS